MQNNTFFNAPGALQTPKGRWYIDDGGDGNEIVGQRNVQRQHPTYVPFQSISNPYAGYGWQGAAQYPYVNPGGVGYGNGPQWAERRPDGARKYQKWEFWVRGIDYR